MKTDDPRIEAKRKEIAERVEKYNALMLATIKAHLAVEQAMDGFLADALFHSKYIEERRFGFRHKMKICQAMSLKESDDKLWGVLGAFSALRNKMAHTSDLDAIQKTMDQLRKVYFNALTEKQAEGLKKEPDHIVAQTAAFLCGGFIATLAEDAKAQRKVIDQHWKPAG